jgi:hypothetical protein
VFPSEGYHLLFGRAGFAPGHFSVPPRIVGVAPIRQIPRSFDPAKSFDPVGDRDRCKTGEVS